MDGWLKGLIALACLAVIGAGGYLVWSERQEQAERAAASTAATGAAASRQMCRERARTIEAGQLSGDDVLVLQECGTSGALDKAAIDKALEARRKRMGG